MVTAFIIWSVLAVGFVVIGIIARNMKKPVGFFANVEAPKVKEGMSVTEYNRAVAKIFFTFAVIFEILGTPLVIFRDNAALIVLFIPLVFFLVIGTMVAYKKVEAKYCE